MKDGKSIKKTLIKEATELLAKRLIDFKLAGKVVVKIDNQATSKIVKTSTNDKDFTPKV